MGNISVLIGWKNICNYSLFFLYHPGEPDASHRPGRGVRALASPEPAGLQHTGRMGLGGLQERGLLRDAAQPLRGQDVQVHARVTGEGAADMARVRVLGPGGRGRAVAPTSGTMRPSAALATSSLTSTGNTSISSSDRKAISRDGSTATSDSPKLSKSRLHASAGCTTSTMCSRHARITTRPMRHPRAWAPTRNHVSTDILTSCQPSLEHSCLPESSIRRASP